MDNQIKDFLDQLKVLASSNNVEVQKLAHEPMSGGYLGQIILEGTKNNFAIRIMVDLDFLQESDGISLSVNPIKAKSENVMTSIQEAISQMRYNFNTPLTSDWINLLSREIKVRTDFYN